MARKDKKGSEPEGAPGWIVTFSDLMSLLLTFFVLLLSFSTVSEQDFKRAILSLQGALGVLPQNLSVLNPMPRRPDDQRKRADELARRLRRQLQVTGNEAAVRVEFDATGGLRITLPEAVLFDSGSAVLKAAAAPLLQEVSAILGDLPKAFIEVRGHSDDRPLTATGDYRDNLELSFWRANAVTRQIRDMGNLDLRQFEVVAVGAGQPVAPNDTPEGRAQNRRVDIYVRGVLDPDNIRELEEQFDVVGAGDAALGVEPVDFSELQGR